MRIDELKDDRLILIKYLFMKARQEDWHGVRDCAVDIELKEAEIKQLQVPRS